MRGVGVPITATVALYLTPPGGSETLLVRSALGFAPFEQKSISGDFTPTTNGKYLLRARHRSRHPPRSRLRQQPMYLAARHL